MGTRCGALLPVGILSSGVDCRPPRRDPSISSTSTANPSRSNSDTPPSLTISKKKRRVDERGSKTKGNRKRNFHIFTIQNKLKNLKRKKSDSLTLGVSFSRSFSLSGRRTTYIISVTFRVSLSCISLTIFLSFICTKRAHYTVTDSRNSRFKHTFINPFLFWKNDG